MYLITSDNMVSYTVLYYILLILIYNADQISPESSLMNEPNDKSCITTVVTEGEKQQKTTSLDLITSKHVESRISENIDATTLIITPSIAPATPLEDLSLTNNVESVKDHEPEQLQPKLQMQQNEEELSNNLEVSNEEERDLDKPDHRVKPDIQEQEKPVDVQDIIEQVDQTSTMIPNSTDKETNEDHSEIHTVYKDSKESSTNEVMSDAADIKMVSQETEEIEGSVLLDEDQSSSREDNVESGENMPSFNEWSQKFLAQEQEKNKVQQKQQQQQQQQNTEQNMPEKSLISKKKKSDRKQNNYASVDCGAKILEKNAEARNAESILIENKDFYMLNPCSVDIWFVLELCDHVHITSLQLANFEMFSSTTAKFQVSFSTRYPTREWSQLQTLEAKPEKDVQTFTLEPVFAKYMKVEQLSHHGSEHYCPWSLLRVYGNSMVEEYEEHESSENSNDNVDNDDETISIHNNIMKFNQQSSGILHSATEAVLNFVKETAKKLVTTPSNNTENTNKTNATNQTENEKAIVQLMYCEDFEESCEDAHSCFKAARNINFSFEKFLEIIYNVCRQNLNITHITSHSCDSEHDFIDKQTIVENNTKNEKHVDNIKNGTKVDNTTNDFNHKGREKDESLNMSESKTMSVKTETSKMNVKSSLIPEEQSRTITQSTVTTAASSVNINNKHDENITINDLDHSSSPTPLAQPPLAIDPNQQPPISSASIEQPTTTTATTTAINTKDSLVEDTTEPKRIQREISTTEENSDQLSDNNQLTSDGQHLIKDDGQVDILKFTVTDETTKEGTAEPEETCAAEPQTLSKMTSKEEQRDAIMKEEKIESVEDKNNENTIETKKQNEYVGKEIEKDETIENKETKEKLCSDEGACDKKESGNLANKSLLKGSSNNKTGNVSLTNQEINTTNSTVGNNDSDVNKTKSNHSKIHSHFNENDTSIQMEKNEVNGKKESIFVVLSKKIKNLEQNVTMTNLFLEELSQRYRKSVEEIQKKMEKTTKTSKFLATINAHQNSTILSLSSKLEKVEQQLEEVTSRLQTINQEVIERHLLGMTIQFFVLFILWLLFARRSSKVVIKEVTCATKMNGEINIDRGRKESSIQELGTPPKTPDGVHGENKRRRKRRQRNNDVHNATDENIVNKTAGLLFHSSMGHENHDNDLMISMEKKTSTKRSCSLNDLENRSTNIDHKTNKSKMSSPRTRKFSSTHQRNDGKKDGCKLKLFHFEEEPSLKKSKSLEETNQKICKKQLTTSCSLQSVNHHEQMKNEKNTWIWGLG